MSRERRLAATLLAVLVAGLAFLAVAPPAAAHSQQIGSTPAADEAVPIAPREVVIEFDSPLVDMGAAVAVRSQDDVSITTGPLVIGDRQVTVPVDPAAAPGTYTVAYRVVSEDGHTMTSTFQYTVEGDAPATEAPAATASAASTPVAVESAVPQPVADSSADSSDDSGISPILIAVVVGLVLIGAVIAAIALRR